MLLAMLGLLRDSASDINAAITGFLATTPNPDGFQVSAFLSLYSGANREAAASGLVARGVSPAVVQGALSMAPLETTSISFGTPSPIWTAIMVASMGLSAYHGYKRNNSVGWGIGWGLLGGLLPIITPVIAVAQGLGKRKAA